MYPFFSVCIPTRNRAEYVKNTIESSLKQDFEDFEIIISDNNSTDDTEQVIKSFDNPKIKYFNTKKDISVIDNFDNIALKANGKYFLIMCDDEVMLPKTLSKFKSIIEKTGAEVIRYGGTSFYYLNGSSDNGEGNFLIIRPFTNEIRSVKSSDVLKVAFNLDLFSGDKNSIYYANRAMPLASRALIKRELFQSIYTKRGKFHAPEPMYSSAIYLLNEISNIIVYDRHCVANCVLPEKSRGNKFQSNRNEGWGSDKKSMEDLYEGFMSPLEIKTLANHEISGMLCAQKHISPDLDEYSINLNNYVYPLLREIMVYRTNGIDISHDLKLIISFCRQHGIKDKYLYYFDQYRHIRPGYIFYYLRRKIERFLERFDTDKQIWKKAYRGKEYNFNNILECIEEYEEISKKLKNNKYARKLFDRYYPESSPVHFI